MCLYVGPKEEWKKNNEKFINKMKRNGGKIKLYKVYLPTPNDESYELIAPCLGRKIKIKNGYIVSDRIKTKTNYPRNGTVHKGIHVFTNVNFAKNYKNRFEEIFEVEGNLSDFIAISVHGTEVVFYKVKPIDKKFKEYKL